MQSKRKDETGHRYGKLVVTGFAYSKTVGKSIVGRAKGGSKTLAFWKCLCDCGRERIVVGRDLRRKDKRKVETCGVCYRITHGHCSGHHSPEYISWHSMISRCTLPNHSNYKDYGGRGISVCQRWINSFEAFLEDMGPRPDKRYSIDRKDVNGNYEPSNCRWASPSEQSRNMKSNIWIIHNGRRMVLQDWRNELHISIGTYYGRIKRGLTPKQALGLE